MSACLASTSISGVCRASPGARGQRQDYPWKSEDAGGGHRRPVLSALPGETVILDARSPLWWMTS